MNHTLEALTAFAGSLARGGVGVKLRKLGKRPEQRLELYEFENCPFCRKVRDVLTELDLEVMVYPCPSGGERFRPKAIALSGKRQFPFLRDPNTGRSLLESDDIITYLFEEYGDEKPNMLRRGVAASTLSALASAVRLTRGRVARPSRAPAEPLELYSFEASPFARLVRERLCELELPYLLHNVGKVQNLDFMPATLRNKHLDKFPIEGESRLRFVARSGKMMVPYLIDPNTGFQSFESARINEYLERTYAL